MAAWHSNVDEYAPCDVDLNGDLHRLLGGDARRTDGEPERQRVSAEWVCRTCLRSFDQDGYCPLCGRQRTSVARSAQTAETRGR